MRCNVGAVLLGLVAGPLVAQVTVTPVSEPAQLAPLPVRVVGRVERLGAKDAPRFRRQWPGTYFETSFRGSAAAFRVGPGAVSLRVTLDQGAPSALVRPAPGLYRLAAGTPGRHILRVQVASESQAGPTEFGGFYALDDTRPAQMAPARGLQIEFVGDSHTVGYGNVSATQSCSEPEIWDRTDTTQSLGAVLAARFDADYQVNAISGRGIVRNYNGFAAPTLPASYPFTLLGDEGRAPEPGWTPQFIVIALGTNDFSTPLNPGEHWRDRAALHADFEQSYVRFVGDLRRRNPQARFVLWATELANGEIADEVRRVYDRLRARGEKRIDFVPVSGLAFSACNGHPSLADDKRIADALAPAIARNLPARLDQDRVRRK